MDDVDHDTSRTFLNSLHAKVYVIESARLAHLFLGSPNATEGGFGGNVEFLCELVGPVAKYGVEALVGEGAPMRDLLIQYVPSETPEIDDTGKVGRALEDLLMDIAADVGFRTTVIKAPDGWMPYLTADSDLPHIAEGTSVTIAPYNLPSETYVLHPGEPVAIELSPREIADITPFLQITASRIDGSQLIDRSTVICSRLEGEPADRYSEIFARQIDTPEKFLRLLALLMGFGSGSAMGVHSGTSGWAESWSAGPGAGVLELLARALSENPESIDHLAKIIDYVRGSAKGMAILPPGWDDVWLPALEARRAMQEADS